jgi:hypothetical protein
MPKSKTKHTNELARELLDDIELSRLGAEQLLLKARRLARFVEDAETDRWLEYELSGYPIFDKSAHKYMTLTGRWSDKQKSTGYFIPLAEIDGHLSATKSELAQLRVPDINYTATSANPKEFVTGTRHISAATAPVRRVLQTMQELSQTIAQLSGVRSRVLSALHSFAAEMYYRLEFSGQAQTIFEKYSSEVQLKLVDKASDVLSKVPAIYGRLVEKDPEAVSQALSTCRRIIRSFADSVYPAQDEVDEVEGLSVAQNAYLNRIELFAREHCASTTRRERIRKTLKQIHDRVCAGVHDDVTQDEAKALFLGTYLILGEVAGLPDEQDAEIEKKGDD